MPTSPIYRQFKPSEQPSKHPHKMGVFKQLKEELSMLSKHKTTENIPSNRAIHPYAEGFFAYVEVKEAR